MRHPLLFLLLISTLTFFTPACTDDKSGGDCVKSTWFQDADSDGLGNPDVSLEACDQPVGYVSNSNDTDDVACDEKTWYEDADEDGLGNPDVSLLSCDQPEGYVDNDDDLDDTDPSNYVVLDVDQELFLTDGTDFTITTVNCTLSNGVATICYEITTNSAPVDHDMGPWCPTNISDGVDAGGIWLEDGKVYDVDGAFIQNMADFYNDNTWKMYDADGKIFVTETEEDCINAANPNVGTDYQNFCVECLPSYITGLTQTFLIPVTPMMVENPEYFATGPGGPMSDIPSTRGVALNGIEFSAPAPVSNILGAYTLAPFDDAGGHINVHQGYHYHAATGVSSEVEQTDVHAGLIGYAMDGHGIYAQLDQNGEEPTDLDACRGHYDEERGYHYHVDAAGNNNFINCLHGAYAN